MNTDKLLDGTGKLLETVPQIYDDGLKDATKESGKFLARIPRAINAALSGLDIWIAQREYNVEATKKLLAMKLESTDPAKIVPPDMHIAVPALRSIAYSMDSPELRDMYANLLAKAMHADLKSSVRAAFVTIIEQMEPIDAVNLKLFRDEIDGLPVAQYRKICFNSDISDLGNCYYIMQSNVFLSNPNNLDIAAQAISLSSLERLGLISINWTVCLTGFDYSPFEETDMFRALDEQVLPPPEDGFQSPRDDGRCIDMQSLPGQAILTPFGSAFLDVCL